MGQKSNFSYKKIHGKLKVQQGGTVSLKLVKLGLLAQPMGTGFPIEGGRGAQYYGGHFPPLRGQSPSLDLVPAPPEKLFLAAGVIYMVTIV